jgi:hypothetical protein
LRGQNTPKEEVVSEISATTPSESTIRRRARREGSTVVKSRAKPPFNGGDYGEYALIGPYGGAVLGWDYDATLENIAEFMSNEEVAA